MRVPEGCCARLGRALLPSAGALPLPPSAGALPLPGAGSIFPLSRLTFSPQVGYCVSPQPGLCAISPLWSSLPFIEVLPLSRCFSPQPFLPPQAARGRCHPHCAPHPLWRVPASATRRAPSAHARPRPFPPRSAGGSRESAVISLLRAVPCCSWRRWSGGAELLG